MPDHGYVDGRVEQSMGELGVPGIALGIYRDAGERVYPCGVTVIDTGFAVRPDTIFQADSISKLFTAVLCMTLVEEGSLDLDQPVQRYVPDFSLQDGEPAAGITTRHLLTHTDGILEEALGLSRPKRPAINVGAAELEALAGRYEQPYATIEVWHNDGLQARHTSHSPCSERQEPVVDAWSKLRPVASDHFIFESGAMEGSQIRFWRNENGGVRFVQTGGRLYRPANGA